MIIYLASRLFRAILSILVVVSLAFIILRSSGDPALQILGPNALASDIAAFREKWGLDQALWKQYLLFLQTVLRGDFGTSMLDGQPALAVVLSRLPMTLSITVPALIVNVLIGIPLGICAAIYRQTWWDRSIMVVSVVGFTVPSFVLSLLLILIFAVSLRWLPSGGADLESSIILPVATLGIGGAAVLARFTRSAMIEVLGELYITAATAKGAGKYGVIKRHALPNAIIPVLTMFGMMVGSQVAGSIIVETVFGWPGVGQLLVTSVANRDLAVVQVVLLLVGLTMTVSNLIVDVMYGLVDPRMRTLSR